MIYLRMLTADATSAAHVTGLCERIWPAPYAEDAAKASIADGLDVQTGQVYQIFNDFNTVMGITGFFDIDSKAGTAYLRWTGLLPRFRGNGYFREAIKALTELLKGANPAINMLIELVPDNEYGRTTVMPAFEAVGFKRREDLPVPPGEDADWAVIPYALIF